MHEPVLSLPGPGALPVAVLFAVTLALFAPGWLFYTGGDSTAAAERILSGQLPYRDFWTLYAPGSFFLLASLFRLFGSHLLVESIAASVLCSAAVCVYYLVMFRLLERRVPAMVCAVILFSVIRTTGYYLSIGPYPPTILCILLSLYCMVLYFRGARRLLFPAGLFTGAVIVFKHDVGGYTGLAISAGIVAGYFAGQPAGKLGSRQLLSALLVYAAGAALVAAPVAVCFAVLAGPDMWQDLIVFPLMDFRFARMEQFPGLLPTGLYTPWRLGLLFNLTNYLKFLLPVVVVVLAVLSVAMAFTGRHREYVAVSVLFIVAFLFHYLSAHAQINTNIISMWLYAAALGAILHDRIDRRLHASGAVRFRWFALVCACGWCAMLLAKPVFNTATAWHDKTETLDLPKISGTRASERTYREMIHLVDFVNSHVSPGQKIFLALHRHDVVVIGYSGLYFALDRKNATRHDQLHPGVVDRHDVQMEIVRDLESNNVEYIIVNHIFSDDWLDRIKSLRIQHLPESSSTYLDDYIRRHYSRFDRFDRYEIWRRTDRPGATGDAGRAS